jgi:hydroxymethylbilane synthase
MSSSLRLGTRGSPLALWQANHVADHLRPVVAPQTVELVLIETHGDRDQASALAAMGGFGVFTKAIQNALLDGRADVAVHSLKDLPTIPTEGLKLIDLRGNVDTRLRKLDEQKLDAIILAEAGLVRLGLEAQITELLNPSWMLPAVGQGAIGLECRVTDELTRHYVEALRDPDTFARVTAERAMLYALGGGCLVPIGATSRVMDGVLTVRGAVLSPDGRRRVAATHSGTATTPLAIGQELAAMLLAEGARELLQPGPSG